MGTSITFNGASFNIPANGDASWGTNVSNFLIAIPTGCLQKTGGSFTLSAADIDFGGTYGLKALYFKSKTASIASTGVLALAVTDTVAWRNNANSADLALGINGSDALTFNSTVLSDTSSAQTLTNKIFSDSTCKFGNVSDTTKALLFSLGGATTGKAMTVASSHTNNRTVTIPDATDTFQMLALAQSPTNKTFDSTSTMTGVKIVSFTPDGTHTLTCPTATDTLVGKATTDTLTNKTISGNTAVTLISGSGTLTLNTSGTVTLPNATDTLMGKATTDTMTNKTATTMAVTGGSYINFLAQAAARFNDSSTNYVAIQSPSSVTTHTYNLPTSQGGASSVLTNDGSGNLSWGASLTTVLNQFNTFIGNASNIATATNTNLLGDIQSKTSSSTFTVTIATPAVFTLTGHGFSTKDKVFFTTTGALPTGLSASTTYWVTVVDANTFKVSSSLANFFTATYVATSGSQSGTHTCFSGGLINTKVSNSNTGSDAATTLIVTDAKNIVVTPTASRTYTLPTTSVIQGDSWTFTNNAAVNSSNLFLLINSSGGNLVRTVYPQSSVTVVALQDSPTTAAHWMCTTPAVTEWTAWTPTGSWTSSVTYTGFWRRTGDSIEMDIDIACSNNPTSASLTVTLPMSLTINTGKLGGSTDTKNKVLGLVTCKKNAGDDFAGYVAYGSSTTIAMFDSNADSAFTYITNPIDATHPITFAGSDNVYIRTKPIPITGWTATKG